MALTITGSEVDAWALNATNTVRIGATVDCSDSYQSVLHIDMALGTTATAHLGTKVLVQCSSSSADNEFWTERQDFLALTGTATIINLDAQITAGETVVPVAATTGFVPGAADVPTLLCLLIDPTVADSELVRAVSYDSGVSVTIMEAVKRTHVTTTSYLANVAKTYAFDLPLGTVRARVIYDNEYDTAGSGIYTRTRITKTTVL